MASLLPGVVFQFEIKPDGTMTFPYASAGIERVYGVTPEQALADGTIVFQAIHPEDRGFVEQTINHSKKSGENWICEYRVINEGVVSWVLGRSKPEFKPDGTVIWHGAILDIISQKTVSYTHLTLPTSDLV